MVELSADSRTDIRSYRPGAWAVNNGATSSSPDIKSPPLADLYPEQDRFLILAPERYFDPAFAAQEWRSVWSKVWTCAGVSQDIPATGQWFRYELGRESIIVVRQKNGAIKAFYNACQHRGRPLVTQDFGTSYSFVCPFHSWVYGLDGTNRRVTNREQFDPRALCGDLGLREVRCETWAGFVFVNLDDAAPPLLEYLDALPNLLRAYNFEAMHVVKDVVVELPCNWKVALEAFLEPYHAHIIHPQILPAVDELINQYDFYGHGHARVITPVGLPSPRYADKDGVNPALAYMLAELGIDARKFNGSAGDIRAEIWRAKRCAENAFGLDYSGYTDSQLTDDWNPSFFPNMTFNAHPEGILVMRFLPHATDATKCNYHVWVMLPTLKPGVRPPAYFGVEPDVDITGTKRPARRHTTLEDPQLGEVMEQDVSNLKVMQRGIMSSGMRNGIRLSDFEQRIQQLHAEIDRLISCK
jgi:phenylpropionate dioxygenase-like ring-hydroxylating dioxygenase large terminal subunit